MYRYYTEGTVEEIQELENKLLSLPNGVELVRSSRGWSKALAIPYITCLQVTLDEYSKGYWH